MSDLTDDAAKAAHIRHLETVAELITSGYCGVDSKGTLRDRRTTPGLIPVQANPHLNTPPPKPV